MSTYTNKVNKCNNNSKQKLTLRYSHLYTSGHETMSNVPNWNLIGINCIFDSHGFIPIATSTDDYDCTTNENNLHSHLIYCSSTDICITDTFTTQLFTSTI